MASRSPRSGTTCRTVPGATSSADADPDSGLQALLEHIRRRRARQRRRLIAAGGSPQAGSTAERPGRNGLAVLELEWLTDNLVRLKLQRPPGLEYGAGQHVKLALGGVKRTYSLVSAPHEGTLEFFIEVVPGGAFSSALAGLGVGDRVALAGAPKGDLAIDRRHSVHLMLATVTGVAPYVSMLRDITRAGTTPQRFIVVHGASHQDELGYRSELEALAERHERVVYVPTVSRPEAARNAGWAGEVGRVPEVAERLVEAYGLSPETTRVYACGNPGMVERASALFDERGFEVETERFG